MKKILFALLILQLINAGCFTRFKSEQDIEEQEPENVALEVHRETFINITMEGGYVYGGFNPITERNITIENDGKVVLSMNHLYSEKFVGERHISRSELEDIAGRIIANGFFEMEDIYDCSSYNSDCQQRKKKYPRPIPLKLWVLIDDFEKEVAVTVFERNMVDYPEGLDRIVEELNELSVLVIEDQ